ncbi:putative nuclease HARBI1 [Amia ocellicauda]|uniref:putative nuclease HARBI1 n=1 Tax=Amia ocellicauda TaxID=2972642 RepID=UPI003464E1D9
MALEIGFAFLLAEELDASDRVPLIADALRKTERDRDNARMKNYIMTGVPRCSISEFQSYFQLTPTQVEELITELEPFYWNLMGRKWPLRNVVLASLWALTTLESYRDLAERFETSKSVIYVYLHEFCALVSEHLSHKICWPTGEAARVSVKGFAEVGFPGTLCAVGACHVPIEKPQGVLDPEAYFNSKQFYSINLTAFCDHVGSFVHVSAEHPGSWHNSQVFQMTDVGKTLLTDPQSLLSGFHIVGDTSYPLSEHLLTPFPDNGHLILRKGRYNYRLLSALKVVDNSFSVLKYRFQRLKSLQMHSIIKTSAAVKTCCILHNMCLEVDGPLQLEDMDCEPVPQEPFHLLPKNHSGTTAGIAKRQAIAMSLGKQGS